MTNIFKKTNYVKAAVFSQYTICNVLLALLLHRDFQFCHYIILIFHVTMVS